MSIKEEYKFFTDNKETLLKLYYGKYIIIKDLHVVESFDTVEEAIRYANRNNLQKGTYLLDLVSDSTFSPRVFHSRVSI